MSIETESPEKAEEIVQGALDKGEVEFNFSDESNVEESGVSEVQS